MEIQQLVKNLIALADGGEELEFPAPIESEHIKIVKFLRENNYTTLIAYEVREELGLEDQPLRDLINWGVLVPRNPGGGFMVDSTVLEADELLSPVLQLPRYIKPVSPEDVQAMAVVLKQTGETISPVNPDNPSEAITMSLVEIEFYHLVEYGHKRDWVTQQAKERVLDRPENYRNCLEYLLRMLGTEGLDEVRKDFCTKVDETAAQVLIDSIVDYDGGVN